MKIRSKDDAKRLAVKTQLSAQDKVARLVREAPKEVTSKPHGSRDWYPAN